MKSKYLLPSALLATSACLMPVVAARADVVLANTVGFIRGTQIFTDSFDITTPGTLTVNIAAINWLDTLQDLSAFVTSPSSGLLGVSFSNTSETMQVQPGDISVNWYGTAAGPFKIGVYAITVDFHPAGTPVPLPASLPLLLSGLGALSIWGRKRRSLQSA